MSFVNENEITPTSQFWETPVHVSTISFYAGTRLITSSILRDATNLYRVRDVEEDLVEEDYEPLDFRRVREPSPRIVARVEDVVQADYDYFDEAMLLFPPPDTQLETIDEGDLSDPDDGTSDSDSIDYALADEYWRRETIDEISSHEEMSDENSSDSESEVSDISSIDFGLADEYFFENSSEDGSFTGPRSYIDSCDCECDEFFADTRPESFPQIRINPRQSTDFSSCEIEEKVRDTLKEAQKLRIYAVLSPIAILNLQLRILTRVFSHCEMFHVVQVMNHTLDMRIWIVGWISSML
jgi:hypothetical protein